MALDPNYQFVHSTSLDFRKAGFYMIINEKNVETGESRLRTLRNPSRPFWITRPNARNHREKKEFAVNSELDMYVVPQNELREELAKKLDMYKGPNAWYDFRKMCDNPYVYGADIDPEVIFRIAYRKQCKPVKSYKVGFLDIEVSMFEDGRVNVLTYIDSDFKIHTAVLKDFMQKNTLQDIQNYKDKVWSDTLNKMNENTKKAVAKLKLKSSILEPALLEDWNKWMAKTPLTTLSEAFQKKIRDCISDLFTFDIAIFDSEKDLLIWSFKNIHETKPDFIGIWNMDFDIPYLIDRLTMNGVAPKDAFSHPDVPYKLHYMEYKQDKGKEGQHFTDKWHWLYSPGYTKYIDSMNLYSRIRKVDGRENSYKLDAISNKEIGIGKMPVTTHEDMQEHHFIEYVVYNMMDSAVLSLMEILNHDMDSMMGLAYISPLHQFAHQTRMLMNNFYEYCREHGMVPASVGGSQLKPTDELIYNMGGAVLDPSNIRGASISAIEENDDMTGLYTMVCDIDVSSMYPSTMIAFNVGKQTKLSSCLGIDGFKPIFDPDDKKKVIYDPSVDFYTHIAAPSENAVWMGKKYFNLVDYREALDLFLKEIAA